MATISKKILIIAVAVAALGGMIVGMFRAPQLVRANFLNDLLQQLNESLRSLSSSLPPPAPSSSSNEAIITHDVLAPATPPVSLYKPAFDYERAVIDAVKAASPAVVSITVSKNVPIIENCPIDPFGSEDFFGTGGTQFYAPCEKGTQFKEVGGGSGFIVSSNGLVLTNKHVVTDEKASYTVFTNDGKKYDATVLARDPLQDIAILRINATNLPIVVLGDSSSIELGQTAIAIGNALAEYRNTVSVGVISGLARTITAGDFGNAETLSGVIQTDAAINPGNSGGPLLSLRGEVIGMNTAIVSGAQNIGFAIPINRAKRDIDSVKATGQIAIPYIGVRYFILTPDLAAQLKLSVDYGAMIRVDANGIAIQPNSPASKTGLKADDVILSLDGRRIDKDYTLADAMGDHQVGDTITLRVLRNGVEQTFRVTLEKRPQ